MRESGPYFVKVHELADWIVAYYSRETGMWSKFRNQSHFNDGHFFEINEKRIEISTKTG